MLQLLNGWLNLSDGPDVIMSKATGLWWFLCITPGKFNFDWSRWTFAAFYPLQVSHCSGMSDPQRSLHHRPVPVPVTDNALLGGECSIHLAYVLVHLNQELMGQHTGFLWFPCGVFTFSLCSFGFCPASPVRPTVQTHAQDDKLFLSVSEWVSEWVSCVCTLQWTVCFLVCCSAAPVIVF